MGGTDASIFRGFECGGEQLDLLPEKAIWLPTHQVLLIADLHLGKVAHFRKNGLAVPAAADAGNIPLLSSLIARFPVQRLLFLGDLFHSVHNPEWDLFGEWVARQTCSVTLIEGNHDILPREHYHALGIELLPRLVINRLLLTHEPLDTVPPGRVNVFGHLHPGVRLQGLARQSLRLPCFHGSSDRFVLPAFGAFTGLFVVSPRKGDQVFAVVEDRVVQVV